MARAPSRFASVAVRTSKQFLAVGLDPVLGEQVDDIRRQWPAELEEASQLGRGVISDECSVGADIEGSFPEREQLVAPHPNLPAGL